MNDRLLLLALVLRPLIVLIAIESTIDTLNAGISWRALPELAVLAVIALVWPVTRDARLAVLTAAGVEDVHP